MIITELNFLLIIQKLSLKLNNFIFLFCLFGKQEYPEDPYLAPNMQDWDIQNLK
jgi:hypothetical protein